MLRPYKNSMGYILSSLSKGSESKTFMPPIPTIDDVARLSKTSRSTVSRVLNNQHGVSDAARRRVQEVIAELHFKPNHHARGLVTGQTGTIGVIVPRTVTLVSADPFFAPVIDGIYKSAHGGQFSVMLWIIDTPTDGQWLAQHLMKSRQVDGVVMIPSPPAEVLYRSLINSEMPCITIGRFNDQSDCYVDIDNHMGAVMAVKHLIDLGRKRIATLTGRQIELSGRDRLEGYKDALQQAGLAFDPALVIEGEYQEGIAYHATKALLDGRCDAIFAANDSMAIGAMNAIQANGLRIPEDIAVVGFDDMPRASLLKPALTTIRQPLNQFGEIATEFLLALIQRQPHAQQALLPTELIIRESSGVTSGGYFPSIEARTLRAT
jgi:LacI family transcriptional regulator